MRTSPPPPAHPAARRSRRATAAQPAAGRRPTVNGADVVTALTDALNRMPLDERIAQEPTHHIDPMPWQAIGHRIRYAWRPWAAGAVVGAAGIAASQTHTGPLAAGATLAGATAVLTVGRYWSRLKRASTRLYTAAVTVAAGAWVTSAGLTGSLNSWNTDSRLSATALLIGTPLAAAGYWHHYRVRRPAPGGLPLDSTGAEICRRWNDTLGWPGGVHPRTGATVPAGKAAKTWLENWRRVVGGWAADWIAPNDGGSFDFERAELKRAIAQTYRVGVTAVSIELDPDDATRCTLLVQPKSPIRDVIRWAGPDSIDPVAGIAPCGLFIDGAPVPYEIFRPGWGTAQEGIYGTTGSGKSEFLNLLLLIERWSYVLDEQTNEPRGLVVSLLHDPQEGQSFSSFRDNVAAFTTTDDEAILIANCLLREMKRRNKYITNVPWRDAKGRRRKGRATWNPLVDGPILSWTIDEAHIPLGNPAFVKLLTRGARMFRKVGIRVRIANHTPLLSDNGGSMALRSMITGGTVVVFRTADALTGPVAFNGKLPDQPNKLPVLLPGTCYVLGGGSERGVKARMAYEEDPYDFIRDDDDQPIGFAARLPAETLEAFGPDFAHWRRTGEVPATATATDNGTGDDPDARARILAVLLAAAGPVQFKEVCAGAKVSARWAGKVLGELVADQVVAKDESGRYAKYALTDAGREQLEQQESEVAA